MCFDKMAMRKHKRSGYLTEYEKLLDKAKDNNVTIYEKYDLSGTRLQGLYCDGSIALSNKLETYAAKYSPFTQVDNYIIYFDPSFGILEIQK